MNLLKPFRNQRGDGTTVMFTTLNMVLLAFFIVLNSIAVISEERKKTALGSLLGSFGMLPGGLSPTKSEQGKLSVPPGPEMTFRGYKIAEFIESLESFALDEGMGEGVILFHGKEGLEVLIASDLAFVKGQAVLQPKVKKLLKKLTLFAEHIKGDLHLIGHVAEGAYRDGEYPDDWQLSWAMAGSAGRFLIANGVEAKRVSVSGYGYLKPMLSDGTMLDAKFADRIEIVLKREVPF